MGFAGPRAGLDHEALVEPFSHGFTRGGVEQTGIDPA